MSKMREAFEKHCKTICSTFPTWWTEDHWVTWQAAIADVKAGGPIYRVLAEGTVPLYKLPEDV